MKHRLFRSFALTIITILLVGSSLGGLLSVILPSAAYAEIGNNDLQLLGKHCHDLHEITYDFGINGNASKCHHEKSGSDPNGGWEEVLNDSLNCSNSMFYQYDKPTDPHDPSVTVKLWFTKQGDYKDCYNKAQTMYNHMSDPNGPCKLTRDGSSNNNDCVADQNNLHNALGCDSHMFQRADGSGQPNSNGNYWIIKQGASTDCQNRINDVGNVQIWVIGSDGQPTLGTKISDPSVSADTSSAPGDGGPAPTTVGCDFGGNIFGIIPFNPLNWLFCGLVKGMGLMVTTLNTEINNMLPIGTGGSTSDNPNQIFTDSNGNCSGAKVCDDYQKAWGDFRDIALGLLAIVGLIIVISQALGMEILDAYTIRKMLPRVLIATVAITLSWQLMRFFVILSNDLGYGIAHLLWSPFSSLHPTIDTSGLTMLTGLSGVAIGAAVLDAFGLMSFLGTAAIAVLITFLVLILRQIAVILLIIVAPIAIIAYVLPNTQRVYKFWWESFSKMLLMFPMIVAFLTVGYIFSAISAAQGKDFIHSVIAFIAFFGPYFAIPLTFRFSGSIMGGIGNAVNSRGEGARGMLRQYRANQAKQRLTNAGLRIRQARVFRGNVPEGGKRDKLNQFMQKASLANRAGIRPNRWGANVRGAAETINMARGMGEGLEHESFKPILGDDDVGQAIMYGKGSRAREMEYLMASGKFSHEEASQKMAHIDAARAAIGQGSLMQAAFLSTSLAKTAWNNDPMRNSKNEDGEDDWTAASRMASDLESASGGNAQTRAQLAGRVLQNVGQSGRTDLKTKFETLNTASKNIGLIKSNTGLNGAAKLGAITKQGEWMHDQIMATEGPGALVGGTGSATEALLPAARRRVEKAADSLVAAGTSDKRQAADRTLTQAVAAVKTVHTVLGQVSPEKQILVSDNLLSQPMPLPGFEGSYMDYALSKRDDPVYFQATNDYLSTYGRNAGLTPEQVATMQQQEIIAAGQGGQRPIPPVVPPVA